MQFPFHLAGRPSLCSHAARAPPSHLADRHQVTAAQQHWPCGGLDGRRSSEACLGHLRARRQAHAHTQVFSSMQGATHEARRSRMAAVSWMRKKVPLSNQVHYSTRAGPLRMRVFLTLAAITLSQCLGKQWPTKKNTATAGFVSSKCPTACLQE